MEIVVLVKQVYDVELNIRIKDGSIVEDGMNYVISGWDEIAIEAALQMVEKVEGEITLITIGPDRAAEALRKGLAMGAHKAIHVKDNALAGSDSFAYAKVLAKVLEGRSYDLILAGKQAQDTDAGLTPSMLAEFLNLPQVTNIVKVENVAANKLALHRKGDHGNEVIDLSLPAVVTVNDSLNEPRLASMRGIMMARKKPIDEINLAGLGLSPNEYVPPTKILNYMEPESRQSGQKFEGDESETTKQVLDKLVNEVKMFA